MRRRSALSIAVIVCGGFALAPRTAAKHSQSTPLEDELHARYKLVKMGFDSSGLAVVEPGTVLVIQKGGILALPPASMLVSPNTYRYGEVHPPGALLRPLLGPDTRFLQAGVKVYVSRIGVNPKAGRVSLSIIECDACNGANSPSSYKAEVIFVFPRGALDTADAAKLRETISEVLAIDTAASSQQQAQDQPGQEPPGGQPSQQQPLAPPTVELGQTMDQVQSMFGQPDRIVNLGSKLVYAYKDLKITFVDGKVADVK